MTTFVESKRIGDVLLNEVDRNLSRDTVTLITGQNLKIGTVLGRILTGAATAAIKGGGNTGNGVFTIDATTPTKAGAKVGIYTARCIIAAANGGTFQVEDPDGIVIGQYVVAAAAFDDEIKFTIADGAADFIVGDGFDITVPEGSLKVTLCDAAANNGSQIAAGVLLNDTDATSADEKTVMVARLAVLKSDGLIYKAGATAPQKALQNAQLLAANIKVLTSV